jgi:hypothetical protein
MLARHHKLLLDTHDRLRLTKLAAAAAGSHVSFVKLRCCRLVWHMLGVQQPLTCWLALLLLLLLAVACCCCCCRAAKRSMSCRMMSERSASSSNSGVAGFWLLEDHNEPCWQGGKWPKQLQPKARQIGTQHPSSKQIKPAIA